MAAAVLTLAVSSPVSGGDPPPVPQSRELLVAAMLDEAREMVKEINIAAGSGNLTLTRERAHHSAQSGLQMLEHARTLLDQLNPTPEELGARYPETRDDRSKAIAILKEVLHHGHTAVMHAHHATLSANLRSSLSHARESAKHARLSALSTLEGELYLNQL